jgi:hypothetical protein
MAVVLRGAVLHTSHPSLMKRAENKTHRDAIRTSVLDLQCADLQDGLEASYATEFPRSAPTYTQGNIQRAWMHSLSCWACCVTLPPLRCCHPMDVAKRKLDSSLLKFPNIF